VTTHSSNIMSELSGALRRALVAHPHLCPIFLEGVLADQSQINDILREFTVRMFRDIDGYGYCVMSPLHVDEYGEPFFCGVFVALDWLSRHALSTREEFDAAYEAIRREHGSGPAHYENYVAAKWEAIWDADGDLEQPST
jgi:hypothetical protein